MKEIVETTHLEFDKSAFLIDLVKHNNGSLYVEVIQTIYADDKIDQSIKINPSVLAEFIQVLTNYQSKLPKRKAVFKIMLTEEEKGKIQDRYLRGISIRDLSMQLGKSEELIEQTLRNRGIEIVSNKIPRKRYWRKKYPKK